MKKNAFLLLIQLLSLPLQCINYDARKTETISPSAVKLRGVFRFARLFHYKPTTKLLNY